MSADHRDGGLLRLWEERRRALFPAGFRGVDVAGVDLVLLDADVAGLVPRELRGGLDDEGVAVLRACVADLDRVLPLVGDDYCASCCARPRAMAGLTAARHLSGAI
ncbi:hypothetical protein [Streptomyces sp. NPDC048737]|uniref:hypothetical protein n=1 Tax=unclassified Streptomyces TaxID=2593676 RepID=UPI0034188793